MNNLNHEKRLLLLEKAVLRLATNFGVLVDKISGHSDIPDSQFHASCLQTNKDIDAIMKNLEKEPNV